MSKHVLHTRMQKLNFALGFMSATLIYTMFFCLYIFVQEEKRKSKQRSLIPGQKYFVPSIGKVTISKTDFENVEYECPEGTLYSVSCAEFFATSRLLLKESGEITPELLHKTSCSTKKSQRFYDKRGRVFSVKLD